MKLLLFDEDFLNKWLKGSCDTQLPIPQIIYKLNFYYNKLRNNRISKAVIKITVLFIWRRCNLTYTRK